MSNAKKSKFTNTLGECLAEYWINYVGWGRATRSEYWWAFLFYSIIGGLIFSDVLGIFWSLATLVPGFCIVARRLHDTNRSNWNACWVFLPIVGWIILLVYLCQKSDLTKNKYGMPRI